MSEPTRLAEKVAHVRSEVERTQHLGMFALAVSLFVNVYVMWGTFLGVLLAVVIPLCMYGAVHGLHQAQYLGHWNWLFVPAMSGVVVLGFLFSYSHFVEALLQVAEAKLDEGESLTGTEQGLAYAIAAMVELLVFGSLVAHQALTRYAERLQAELDTLRRADAAKIETGRLRLVEERSAVAVASSVAPSQPRSAQPMAAVQPDPDPAGPEPVTSQAGATGEHDCWKAEAIKLAEQGWSYQRISDHFAGRPGTSKAQIGKTVAAHKNQLVPA